MTEPPRDRDAADSLGSAILADYRYQWRTAFFGETRAERFFARVFLIVEHGALILAFGIILHLATRR